MRTRQNRNKQMKRFYFLMCVLGIVACSDSATVKIKVDSTVNKIDSTAKAVFDSTKEKVKDIKENLDTAFKKKDSTGK